MSIVLAKSLLFSEKWEYQFSWSVSQNGLIFKQKFPNIHAFKHKGAGRNLNSFHQQKNSFNLFHRRPKLCGNSLDFEFIRDCMKINKLRPKFHFLTKLERRMTYLVFLFCFLLSFRLQSHLEAVLSMFKILILSCSINSPKLPSKCLSIICLSLLCFWSLRCHLRYFDYKNNIAMGTPTRSKKNVHLGFKYLLLCVSKLGDVFTQLAVAVG